MKVVTVSCLMLFVAGCATTDSLTPQFTRTDPKRGQVAQVEATANSGASKTAPVMIRIIKEDKKLELWKEDVDQKWSRIKSYEICYYSGDLGPKKKQGDYQAPEGFYEITKAQLNPHSREHLSMDTGYPNNYDRFYGYTGSNVMIHGGCSSAGCYAITDKNIEEVYASVRDALNHRQKSVQLQIYPFAMTDWRMRFEKENPNYNFWRQLKLGWDYFDKNQKVIPITVSSQEYKLK